jgi:AraC family transcriptional regulator of adaptative response / DNA-3-methyladenine glycosylase II
MHEDFDACYRAVQSRDARFDGWFFTAVTSTGIYCRPSCPALTPKAVHVRFFPSAAAAQQAGFRACKRCRPDASPGSPEWDVRADVVARVMRLINDGVVDREGVSGLAARVGYSVRQLQRQMVAEVGAAPLAIARAQRAQTARLLIETTTLGFGQVAFASGFASIRQFNDTVRAVFGLTPTELRARARHGRAAAGDLPGSIHLRLPFRAPFHPDSVFGHLVATAVPGVESWSGGAYRRTLQLPHGHGIVALTPRVDHVGCSLLLSDLRDLGPAVARARWLLDLDADPVAVDGQLSADAALAPLVAKTPGRRIPRTVDGAELAIRVVLGQQISTAAARTVTARAVRVLGEPLPVADGELTHLFPGPERWVSLDPATAGVPRARAETLRALAAALDSGALDLRPGADRQRALHGLSTIAGVGPWTMATVAMRALGDPDVLPATDLGVVAAAREVGLASNTRALAAHAESWRPWRSYATQYLWGALDHPINHLPGGNS